MSGDQLGGARRTPQTPLEEFADGEIKSYRGRVDGWLLVVSALLALWGVYYLFAFWGGLGPGQAR